MGALPAGRRPADSPRLLERFQGVTKALVFDREHFTKFRSRQHSVFGKEIQHSFLKVTSFHGEREELRGRILRREPPKYAYHMSSHSHP